MVTDLIQSQPFRGGGKEDTHMGIMDELRDNLGQAAHEVEKAFDKGKTKVGELQIQMQMDGLAKKLGFLVFDFYRGRTVDQAVRQKLLDDLSRLEDQLLKIRAEAAAKAQAESAGGQQPPAGATPQNEPDGTPSGTPNP